MDFISIAFRSGEPPPNGVADYHVCSASGRGYPDVAARGNGYIVVIGGQTFLFDGTSASTPVRNLQDKHLVHLTDFVRPHVRLSPD